MGTRAGPQPGPARLAKPPQEPPDSGPRGEGPKVPTWHSRHLWQIQPVRDVLILLGVFGLLYLGYVLRTVTVPLLLALLLAYLLEPVVRRLEKTKYFTRQGAVSAILASVVVFAVVPIALGTAFAVVQGVGIAGITKDHIDRFTTVTSYTRQHDGAVVPHYDPSRGPVPSARPPVFALQFYDLVEPEPSEADPAGLDPVVEPDDRGGDPLPLGVRVVDDEAHRASAAFENLPGVLKPVVYQYLRRLSHDLDAMDQEGGSLGQLLDWGLGIIRGNAARMTDAAVQGGRITLATGLATVMSVGMLLFTLFLTGFFFYFLSTGYAKVRDFGYEVLPHQHRDRIVHMLGQMDKVVAGFVRGRITIAIIQSIVFTIAYWLIGVPAPLIFGPLVGILSIVPYVALLGIPITIAALAIDNSGFLAFQQTWWWTLAAPLAVYFAGQAVDDYLLTPAIQGKATNMDVPTILFASLAGGILAGIYGLLLAIPVAACVKILLRELFWPRFHAWLRGEEKDFLPLKR